MYILVQLVNKGLWLLLYIIHKSLQTIILCPKTQSMLLSTTPSLVGPSLNVKVTLWYYCLIGDGENNFPVVDQQFQKGHLLSKKSLIAECFSLHMFVFLFKQNVWTPKKT